MDKLFQQIIETASTKCRMRPGRILVALSGGPDSVALLHLLHEIKHLLDIEVVAGHVHHHLRESADEDAEFCRHLAKTLGIEFQVRHVYPAEARGQRRTSLETVARELRYRALNEMADDMHCQDIAIGHTANDQAETVLYHFVRGSGLRGLAGIPYRLERKIRPLLDIWRQDLLQFLKDRNIPYRLDPTNADRQLTRNMIRHEVLPYLRRALNPALDRILVQSAQIHQEAEMFIHAEAEKALEETLIEKTENKFVLDIEQFWSYFTILRKYMLRNALEQLTKRRLRPDFDLLQRAETLATEGTVGSRLSLNEEWELLIDHDGLVLWDGSFQEFEFNPIRPGEEVTLPQDRVLSISKRIPYRENVLNRADKNNQFVDADTIEGHFWVRNVKAGDRFYPLGLKGSKKVFDLLSDRKVPLHKKKETPVLGCNKGIVWLIGFHLDDRFKIKNSTREMYHLQVRERSE